jgi:hypothetical protein
MSLFTLNETFHQSHKFDVFLDYTIFENERNCGIKTMSDLFLLILLKMQVNGVQQTKRGELLVNNNVTRFIKGAESHDLSNHEPEMVVPAISRSL